jgi:glycosyltransferase involved in cell wall biosynthesis
MKKILYLSQQFPQPPNSGGKIKTLNSLLTLSKKYLVFAVFISDEKVKKKDLKILTDAGIQVKIFYKPSIRVSVKNNLGQLLKNYLLAKPYYVFQYAHTPAADFIEKTINFFDPNVIHVDHLNMSQYLPQVKTQKWILEHHNVETYLYWTSFFNTKKLLRKYYLLIEMFLTYFFEKRMLTKFDYILAISSTEKRRLERIFRVKQIAVQPVILPVKPVEKTESETNYILFVGTLGWPPNQDAVEWFIKKVMPSIEKTTPEIEFHVVGYCPPYFKADLPDIKNLFLHGYQVNLKPLLSKADVFVLPFRIGGGLRIKSLTAMASGIPIVSTKLGIDGLGVKHNRECLIANEPEEFGKAVIRLFRSEFLRKRLSKAALSYMMESHSEKNNLNFLSLYEKIIQ